MPNCPDVAFFFVFFFVAVFFFFAVFFFVVIVIVRAREKLPVQLNRQIARLPSRSPLKKRRTMISLERKEIDARPCKK